MRRDPRWAATVLRGSPWLGIALVLLLGFGCTPKPEPSAERVEPIRVEGRDDPEHAELDLDDEPSTQPPPPDVGAPPTNATRSASGLAWLVLERGDGPHPKPGELVTLEYTAWQSDGTMVDSTTTRGRPEVLVLDQLIPGWQEGIKMMKPGESRRFWVPSGLGHGGGANTPEDSGLPLGDLVFDTKLIRSMPVPDPPKTPADVAIVPDNAVKSRTGLASRRLRKGTGLDRPTVISEVTVHYSLWGQDGTLYETSVTQGQPLTVALFQMPPGWVEGLGMMVTGEKRRFWMPEALAYPDGEAPPGQPNGVLVFDFELLAFQDAPTIGVGVPNDPATPE